MIFHFTVEIHLPCKLTAIKIAGESPGLPTPIEPGGTYARSSSPEPPYLGKRIYTCTHVYGYWLPLAMTKTPPFPGFLGKSSRDYGQKYPISREWECACGPLSGGGGGGGGGGWGAEAPPRFFFIYPRND